MIDHGDDSMIEDQTMIVLGKPEYELTQARKDYINLLLNETGIKLARFNDVSISAFTFEQNEQNVSETPNIDFLVANNYTYVPPQIQMIKDKQHLHKKRRREEKNKNKKEVKNEENKQKISMDDSYLKNKNLLPRIEKLNNLEEIKALLRLQEENINFLAKLTCERFKYIEANKKDKTDKKPRVKKDKNFKNVVHPVNEYSIMDYSLWITRIRNLNKFQKETMVNMLNLPQVNGEVNVNPSALSEEKLKQLREYLQLCDYEDIGRFNQNKSVISSPPPNSPKNIFDESDSSSSLSSSEGNFF
jgi:hypothetical protein